MYCLTKIFAQTPQDPEISLIRLYIVPMTIIIIRIP